MSLPLKKVTARLESRRGQLPWHKEKGTTDDFSIRAVVFRRIRTGTTGGVLKPCVICHTHTHTKKHIYIHIHTYIHAQTHTHTYDAQRESTRTCRTHSHTPGVKHQVLVAHENVEDGYEKVAALELRVWRQASQETAKREGAVGVHELQADGAWWEQSS